MTYKNMFGADFINFTADMAAVKFVANQYLNFSKIQSLFAKEVEEANFAEKIINNLKILYDRDDKKCILFRLMKSYTALYAEQMEYMLETGKTSRFGLDQKDKQKFLFHATIEQIIESSKDQSGEPVFSPKEAYLIFAKIIHASVEEFRIAFSHHPDCPPVYKPGRKAPAIGFDVREEHGFGTPEMKDYVEKKQGHRARVKAAKTPTTQPERE